MPYYDLKCKCGEEFNKKASIKEREEKLITCPICGANELEAVFKNVNIGTSRVEKSVDCPNSHRCNGCCGH